MSDGIAVQRCPVCVESKISCFSFKSCSAYRASSVGELIHSDVCSFEVPSREGYNYFITFIDDFSKFTTIYPMKSKSDAFSCFKVFQAKFEVGLSATIKKLRTDNGGEYLSTAFLSYLSNAGIEQCPGPPHSPQLNGVSERTNRTICNHIRCSLLSSALPKSFWVDALRFLSHSLNSIPCNTPSGFVSPSSLLPISSIDPSRCHPFGCETYYKIPDANCRKLDPKGSRAIFLSYLPDGNGFNLWDLSRSKLVKSRDVLFHDDVFPTLKSPSLSPLPSSAEIPWPSFRVPPPPLLSSRPSLRHRRLSVSIHNPASKPLSPSMFNTLPVSPPPTVSSPPAPLPTSSPVLTPAPLLSSPSSPTIPASTPVPPPLPRRSGRTRPRPVRFGSAANSAQSSGEGEIDTPKTWKQLFHSPNKDRWLKAADAEFSSLLGMGTWKLVPRPEKRKIIRSKWVFKVKGRVDKTILKLKAWLVAMGYSQVEGVDYGEDFAPTTRLETLRLVLSMMASRKWRGRQVDIKTAFLNGYLDEPVYMTQPPGYEDPDHPDWVCEVSRSIYGLKQSPRQWNIELHTALITIGLTQSRHDPTLC